MALIDDLLAEAVSSGRLTALTLWKTNGKWQANAKGPSWGWNCVSCDDPVAGVREALTGPFLTPSVSPNAPAKTETKKPAKAADGSVFD